ncbi:MAG: Asp-tRNA(Asn)/Glu-tRNA(Gln) amidotransferase subunit GatA [Bradyrhizobiaceae bacterium]|nr:Asp-tRNA(Asn)/Glu-tRNA(Gln) amidotransferase subunit GatA [Bradyrhizobiaceae bacterium]
MTYAEDRLRYTQGTTSVVERVSECLKRIETSTHNAYLQVLADEALKQAQESDERFASGLARPLEGMIVAVKDNISLKGARLTCASRMLETFEPVFDATVIERLRDAGAVFIGKTNMDEFAMGSSNETSAFGNVHHPTHPGKVPGGSSGGSAVAVAASTCHVALGSDTGGSVRQPAAFCGVYGLKPSYGAVSRYGLVAFASSLDQIGVFANSAADAAAVMEVIGGHDPMDSTSCQEPLPAARSTNGPRKIGRIGSALLKDCSESVVQAYEQYCERLINAGCTVVEIELPASEVWIPTYFILATAEASSNLARFDGVRYGLRVQGSADGEVDMITATRSAGFGTEVKRRIMLGTYVLSSGYHDAYYVTAQKARRVIADGYTKVFEQVDLLVMPTTPTPAFDFAANVDPVQMWLSDLFTVSANIAGIPAMSIPVGLDANGLPIGIQVQAPMFADADMLAWADGQSNATP